jgi:hypothetical protein
MVGCTDNKENQTFQQPADVVQEYVIFDHELFSMELPGQYTLEKTVIRPKNRKDFHQIVFAISEKTVEAEKLLEEEENYLDILCSQTDACGKIISSEMITVDNSNGIKFTKQIQGRSLSDTSGYSNEYHYSILNSGNLFRFWTGASDLENPAEVSKKFDEIIETISFK